MWEIKSSTVVGVYCGFVINMKFLTHMIMRYLIGISLSSEHSYNNKTIQQYLQYIMQTLLLSSRQFMKLLTLIDWRKNKKAIDVPVLLDSSKGKLTDQTKAVSTSRSLHAAYEHQTQVELPIFFGSWPSIRRPKSVNFLCYTSETPHTMLHTL